MKPQSAMIVVEDMHFVIISIEQAWVVVIRWKGTLQSLIGCFSVHFTSLAMVYGLGASAHIALSCLLTSMRLCVILFQG